MMIQWGYNVWIRIDYMISIWMCLKTGYTDVPMNFISFTIGKIMINHGISSALCSHKSIYCGESNTNLGFTSNELENNQEYIEI